MYALIAQAAEATTAADFTSWGQLTATGAVIGLVIWLVTRGFPHMMSEHRSEMKEVRDWHEEEVSKVRADSKEERECFERCVDKFNDTTVRMMDRMNGSKSHPQ